MRAVWSLICFLPCALPAAAAENWFLPYEPDAHTIVLVHLDGPQAGERAEARTPAQVTLTDNAQHADGRFSGGVALAGPKQCVRVDGVPGLILDNDADFTVELWCRPKTAASASLFSLGTRFYCTIDPGRGTASFGYRSADFPIRWFPVTGVPIRRNRWQHVAVTHDRNRVVRFYVNGALAATTAHGDEGDYADSSPRGTFGAHDGWSKFFAGSLDEIRVSNVVREYRPILTWSNYLPGETIRANFDADGLPESVARIGVDVADPSGKTALSRTIHRADISEGLLPADDLPAGPCRLRLSFRDRDGAPISELSVPVRMAGDVLADIETRLEAVERTLKEHSDDEALSARLTTGRLLASRVGELVGRREFQTAQSRLAAAERAARMLQSGEAKYRAQIRRAVRSHPPRNDIRISMSWEADTHAAEAFPWAKRLGANELVGHAGRGDNSGLAIWKRAGYRTVVLGSRPIHDNAWIREHPEHRQYGYWTNDPTRAEGTEVALVIESPTWGGESISTFHDPKGHWKVVDLTTGQTVPPGRWDYDESKKTITVRDASPGHEYRVYFMIATGGIGDPLLPEYADHSLQALEEMLAPIAKDLDAYWFDDLGYAYTGNVPQGAWDWESYALAARPESQARFTQATGIPFDPQWLVMPPRTIEVVPHRNYVAWMRWVQDEIRPWVVRATDVCHNLGLKTWLYWGDCHVGIEPYLGSLSDGKLDEVDKPSGDAVTARALTDFPGDIYRRFRVDWLHTHVAASDRTPGRMMSKWNSAVRGFLMKPIRGIYWMPFPNVAKCSEEAIREDITETLAEINDEFRLIGERLADVPAYTHDIDLYVVNSWGKQYSWRPWGAPILMHLTDLPVRVHFISFAEVAAAGVPPDAEALFIYGLPNSSWSGGHLWESGELAAAIEKFLAAGGGLIGMQAPSYCERPKPRWALESLLGVRGEGTARYEPSKIDASMLTDTAAAPPEDEAYSASALLKTRADEAHPFFAACAHRIGGLRDAVTVALTQEDATPLYLARDANGAMWSGMVVRRQGRGRVVYLSGHSPDFAFYDLLRRAIFWATQHEHDAERLCIEGADHLYVYAYPRTKTIAVLNAGDEPANATLRCDPAILGLGDGVITLADVATGESMFRGASLRLSAGIPVSAVPHCVRLFEVSAL